MVEKAARGSAVVNFAAGGSDEGTADLVAGPCRGGVRRVEAGCWRLGRTPRFDAACGGETAGTASEYGFTSCF